MSLELRGLSYRLNLYVLHDRILSEHSEWIVYSELPCGLLWGRTGESVHAMLACMRDLRH